MVDEARHACEVFLLDSPAGHGLGIVEPITHSASSTPAAVNALAQRAWQG